MGGAVWSLPHEASPALKNMSKESLLNPYILITALILIYRRHNTVILSLFYVIPFLFTTGIRRGAQ